jgi:hypothetical protein
MARLLLLVVPIAVLAGCQTENKAFCANPSNAGLEGCPGDANNGGCGSDGDCKTADFPVCIKPSADSQGTCKACLDSTHGACGGMTPRCESNSCVACVDDGDCQGGTGVCLPTGDCAATSRIIHATSNSRNMMNCGDSVTNPCALVSAILLATSSRDVIKLDGGDTFNENGFTVSKDVTIDARGATLTRGDMGPVLTVMGGKTLTLIGGTISGAHGGAGSAISCSSATIVMDATVLTMNEQSGVDANGCSLKITKARIENNNNQGGALAPGIKATGGVISIARTWIATNKGGGLKLNDAQFTIVGNVFVNNGDTTSQVGGVSINTSSSNNRFEFNSIARNNAQQSAPAIGVPGGVSCAADSGFTAKNNIIWNNNSYFAANQGIQIQGACLYTYSDIGPNGISVPADDPNHNQNNDPMFKNESSDLHLTAASPSGLRQSDPGASLADPAQQDIDGDLRASPVYIGADQPKP